MFKFILIVLFCLGLISSNSKNDKEAFKHIVIAVIILLVALSCIL